MREGGRGGEGEKGCNDSTAKTSVTFWTRSYFDAARKQSVPRKDKKRVGGRGMKLASLCDRAAEEEASVSLYPGLATQDNSLPHRPEPKIRGGLKKTFNR